MSGPAVERYGLGGRNPREIYESVHPDGRMVSSLEDVYEALDRSISQATDLAILAVRHLGVWEQRRCERMLADLLWLRARVMPDASDEGPF